MNSTFRAQTIVLAAAVVLTAVSGCNKSTPSVAPADYFVTGCLVQVIDHDDAHATARIWQDDSFSVDDDIRLNGTDLPYFESHVIDSAYQAILRPAAGLAGDTVYFAVKDGTRFSDSLAINVVDTFSIAGSFDPQNRLLPGGGPVSFNWTGAANAEGYIVAAVKAAEIYTGVGYSEAVASGANAATIPSSVFVDPVTSVLDTGMYYIYVYAYSGSPDSAQASHWLPTPMPTEFPLNIDQDRLTGAFGTVTVTAHDSVYVTSGR